MAIGYAAEIRAFERRFFLALAVLFPIAVIIGFGQTYYLKGLFNGPSLPSLLVHFHGLIMTSWILLFITQVYLIRSKRIKIHQTLGKIAVGLAVLIVIVGFMTAIAAGKRGSSVPGIGPMEFMIVPFGDVTMFAILFAGAIYYRKNAANHKRLILLTILNFLPPALGRFPFEFAANLGPLWFYGVPDVLALIFVGVDTWRNRKLNKVFLAGALLMIASHPLRLMFSSSETWIRFATWLTS